KGGEFVFPDDSCGINFSGFNGIVECSWKATAYSHLTLPSNTHTKSLHPCMGLSCQLPRRLKRLLNKSNRISIQKNLIKATGLRENIKIKATELMSLVIW
ncbi:hypothetical protein VP01_7605g2, partial [Puccinia sorghi]